MRPSHTDLDLAQAARRTIRSNLASSARSMGKKRHDGDIR